VRQRSVLISHVFSRTDCKAGIDERHSPESMTVSKEVGQAPTTRTAPVLHWVCTMGPHRMRTYDSAGAMTSRDALPAMAESAAGAATYSATASTVPRMSAMPSASDSTPLAAAVSFRAKLTASMFVAARAPPVATFSPSTCAAKAIKRLMASGKTLGTCCIQTSACREVAHLVNRRSGRHAPFHVRSHHKHA